LSSFPRTSLGEIADFVNGDRGSNYPSEDDFVPNGVPFISAADLADGVVDLAGVKRISREAYERLRSGKTKPGDILFCLRGSLGKAGRVFGVPEAAIASSLVIIRAKQTTASRFLYYVLQSPDVQGFMDALDNGSVQPNLSVREITKIVVPDISAHEQRAIDHILGTLDDKIELNRRMNETLEAMARALFKSWFVDFDPVRTKMDGRWRRGESTPGLPNHLYDLFPDRLVPSELGDIPKGWAVQPLPEVVAVNPTRYLRRGEVAPYLDMANMPTRGQSPDVVIDRAFGSGMRFLNGDTLVARITPCLENGKTAFVDFLDADQVGWGSTEFIVLRPKPPLPPEFAYCLARSVEFRNFAIQSMTGSSGRQRVPADALSQFKLVVGPRVIAELLGSLIQPLFARARAAIRESRTLAGIRDALLPKLISGELRMECAERFTGGGTA